MKKKKIILKTLLQEVYIYFFPLTSKVFIAPARVKPNGHLKFGHAGPNGKLDTASDQIKTNNDFTGN